MSRLLGTIVLASMLIVAVGCEHDWLITEYRFLQPDKAINKPDETNVSWIVDSMTELDKTEEMFPNAVRPGPQDWIYKDEDYRLAATDVVDISIYDLYAEGLETQLRRVVSDSGYIDMPLLKQRIRAEGMTAQELTDELKRAYSPDVLRDPQLSVIVAARRMQTFSILGAVQRAGTYNLTRPDMRLLDALALAGGVYRQDLEYIYVIRQAPAIRKSQLPQPGQAAPQAPAEPTGDAELQQLQNVLGALPLRHGEVYFAETGGAETAPAASGPVKVDTSSARTKTRWVYQNGKWVQAEASAEPEPARPPVPAVPQPAPQPQQPAPASARPTPAQPAPATPAAPQPRSQALPTTRTARPSAEDPFGWSDMVKEDLVRVIAINYPKLRQGDYRQNIVVRENDVIRIPQVEPGEFYVMGEVLRPGVYSLTGRDITIKQAVAAAGNLGALAWPANSVLIRRIGKNQEQIIPINLEKIIQGSNPDVYLKPDDVIAVGTHWSTSFLAVIRNAFRMTYGFGLIYDRNFSDPLQVTPNSRRFKAL